MTPKALRIECAVIAALFVLLSVLGIIWDISGGLLTGGIDGIMLLFVCLMTAGIFSLMLLLEMQKAGIIPAFGAAKAGAAATPAAAKSAPAAKPAAAEPQATVQTK